MLTLSLRTSINIVCCGVVHHCSHTAHIHDDKLVTCYKDASEHYRDCNGNGSAHVQGRRQLDLVLLLSGLCNTTLTYHVNVLQVAALALLLVLKARCASIILFCGVVHHCSYTAHIQSCE